MALYLAGQRTQPIANVWFANDDGHYYTTTTSGGTFLELTFTPYATNSKFLIIATINGAAADDASSVLQRYTSGSWQEPDSLRGSSANSTGFRGSFGDFSVTRATEDKQTLQFTAVFVDQPNTAGTIGYRVRYSAENTNGCWINRPMGTDGGYNTNSSRSTLAVFEIVQ